MPLTDMDYSSSKRRKTSTATSLQVNNQNTQLGPHFHDGERTPTRLASSMSPTKASLARFNPGLLPPTSSALSRRRGSSGSQHAYSQGLTANGVKHGHAVTRAKSTEPSIVAPGMTPTFGPKVNGWGLFATPKRRSRTPEGGTTPSKKAKLVVVEDIRASPPEEAREGDNVMQDSQNMGEGDIGSNGLNTQSHRMDVAGAMPAADLPQLPSTPSRPGLQGLSSGVGQQDDGEPSLPSTPLQLGLEKPPEPPKGLLFSSPSRRPKRIDIARIKFSPLKPRPEDPVQPFPRPNSPHSSLGPRVYIPNTPRPLLTAQEVRLSSMKIKLAELEKQLQEKEDHLIRKLLVSGREEDSGKGSWVIPKLEKETLAESTRVIRLREELCQFDHANATALDTGGHPPNQEAIDKPRNGHAATARSSPLPKVQPLSQRLAQFLPFSRRPPLPIPKPPSPRDQSHSQTLYLKSTADGVAPFTVTTSDSVLHPASQNDLLQSQIIGLSSPSQALGLKLHVTINVVSQTVTQMQVMELNDWAEAELGAWLRASSRNRSIATVGAAFGRYWTVCLQRLKCWNDAARDYGDIIPDDSAISKIALRSTNADLTYVIPHFCWQELCMARNTLSLTIQWHVSISDDGNVRSDVSALANFPETWRGTENGAELDKVGEAFTMLMSDRGAAEAICVVAGLLFPR